MERVTTRSRRSLTHTIEMKFYAEVPRRWDKEGSSLRQGGKLCEENREVKANSRDQQQQEVKRSTQYRQAQVQGQNIETELSNNRKMDGHDAV